MDKCQCQQLHHIFIHGNHARFNGSHTAGSRHAKRVVEKSLKALVRRRKNKETTRGDLPLGCRRSKLLSKHALPHISKSRGTRRWTYQQSVRSSSSPTKERYIGTISIS